MSTRKSQRIGIWIIAFVMVFGTLGAFFLPILINDSANQEATEQQKLLDEYKKQMEEAQSGRSASSQPLEGYEATPFEAGTVTSLVVEDLVVGEGKEVTADSTISANYFGWTSDGKIFDSSNQNGTTTPIEFPLSGVIPGWTEGLTGAKVGTVRKLTIPADKAYGEAGSPPSIGPNQPLVFIVQVTAVK